MPIGKIAASLLQNPIVKSVVEPINAGVTGFGVASGDSSLGENLAGTAAGVGAFHYARKGAIKGVATLGAKASAHSSKYMQAAGKVMSPRVGDLGAKFAPNFRNKSMYEKMGKGMNLGMVPGRFASTLGVVGGTLGAMAVAPIAVNLARKYMPIWKRKVPTGQQA